jgi:hypothetical protein
LKFCVEPPLEKASETSSATADVIGQLWLLDEENKIDV